MAEDSYNEKMKIEFEIVNLVQASEIIGKTINDRGEKCKEFDYSRFQSESGESLKILIDAGKEKAEEYVDNLEQERTNDDERA